jgi:hypothetical protein
VIAFAFLVVVIGLFVWGLWARSRSHGEVTRTYRTTLAILAAGAGTAIAGSVLPVYVIARHSIMGGTLPPRPPRTESRSDGTGVDVELSPRPARSHRRSLLRGATYTTAR